jgi:hypothetical protein
MHVSRNLLCYVVVEEHCVCICILNGRRTEFQHSQFAMYERDFSSINLQCMSTFKQEIVRANSLNVCSPSPDCV